MAYDALTENKHGLMASISNGKFAMVPIPNPKEGPRRVDLDSMFNKDRYRPSYTNKEGLPVFLTRT
jgi:6-phosphofructokinase 1